MRIIEKSPIRPPRNGGVEFYTGISRSKLNELAGKGRIETRSIREPGQVKGTRLFHLQSILDFIEECEQTAACPTPPLCKQPDVLIEKGML
jgi:hypothetical protein